LVGRPRHTRAAARGAKVHGVIADSQHVGPVILRYFNKGGHATNNGLPFSTRLDLVAAELAFAQMQLIPQ
jgi:hypothetical protein